MWNNFVFSFFNADISIDQGLALSLILSTLYITLSFTSLKKGQKVYFIIPLFHFCNYNIILSLFNQFGLTIEYGKLEVFYFSRLTKNFNFPSLDLSFLEGSIL